jgi:hypothetical protein
MIQECGPSEALLQNALERLVESRTGAWRPILSRRGGKLDQDSDLSIRVVAAGHLSSEQSSAFRTHLRGVALPECFILERQG